MACGKDAQCDADQFKDPMDCCKPCTNICDPRRGTMNECLQSPTCAGWLQQQQQQQQQQEMTTTMMQHVDSATELEEQSGAGTYIVIAFGLAAALFVVVALVMFYMIRKGRRQKHNAQHREATETDDDAQEPLKLPIQETGQTATLVDEV